MTKQTPAQTKAQADWYARNRDRILAERKTPEVRAQHNARARDYYHRHKDKLNAQRRARHLQSRYGLSVEQFDELLAAQGFTCAICETPTPARGWHVDHDHACCPTSSRSCGKCIRGVLCSRCNKALGAFLDSTTVLLRAIRYLEASR